MNTIPLVPDPLGDPERLRRALAAVVQLLNPLLLQGLLIEGNPQSIFTYGIAKTPFLTNGTPANSLGVKGAVAIDYANGKIYDKTGASTWTLRYTFATGSTAVGATSTKATAQSIPDNTFTPLSLPTLVRDDGSFWDSLADTKFTITTPGWYVVGATVLWAANSNGQRRLALQVNGTTTIAYTTIISGAAGNDPSQNVCTPHYFAANDYVEAWAFQNGIGVALNTQNARMSITS